MTRPFLTLITLITSLLAMVLWAEVQIPPLSGRVVDRAELLTAEERYKLTELIQQYESESSNQLVVTTLPELQGITIEEYANQLAREWKLGQKKKNNGILFLIAPKERKVRIEVGYGLEGALTDALSANIIQTKVLPEFQKGDFAKGINAGVSSIIAATKNEYVAEPVETKKDRRLAIVVGLFLLLVMLHLFGSSILSSPVHGRNYKRGRFGGYYGSGGFGAGHSGGGFSGGGTGGFSGGGGGFGGGGASGGW
ncbi:TPM domain-containing protein [Microbulbifer variabilis]|uniref:TPM domain-containing protein n=1 Tax=Microbulbifer variabilis TaxID=266805 RepID=UPI001CFC7672|nr:TPM domain-containing protein [Microbulbifer variabilis]